MLDGARELLPLRGDGERPILGAILEVAVGQELAAVQGLRRRG